MNADSKKSWIWIAKYWIWIANPVEKPDRIADLNLFSVTDLDLDFKSENFGSISSLVTGLQDTIRTTDPELCKLHSMTARCSTVVVHQWVVL